MTKVPVKVTESAPKEPVTTEPASKRKRLNWDWRWVALVTGDILIAVAAPVVRVWYSASMPSGAAVIAVWTYLLVWLVTRDPAREGGEATKKNDAEPTTNAVRDAITAAFVVTYLVLVGWTLFIVGSDKLSAIAEAFLPNFTLLTGTVVLSYFGADAVKQYQQIQHPPLPGNPPPPGE